MKEDKNTESLVEENKDPLIHYLNKIVVYIVKFLAIMMVVVILWAMVDVVFHVYRQITGPIATKFNIENLFSLLGAFLAVLIAIEIFLNIIFYLKKDAVNVPLVLGTALTAVARKVIILDYTTTSHYFIFATAAAILAVGISYWLITKK